MKQLAFISTLLCLLTSCVTILNDRYDTVKVHTTRPGTVIHGSDTLQTRGNKVRLQVERKKEPVTITAVSDSIVQAVELRPSSSWVYWLNIPLNYGIGMLVDRNNPKRYAYPGTIYLNSSVPGNRYFRYPQNNNQGAWYLHLSLPHVNSFRLVPQHESAKINTGFWGITVGADHYYAEHRFLNIGVSLVSDFFVPVPAAVDISGEYELMSSGYISVSNNHKLKRFTAGYGVSYALNTWDLRYYPRFTTIPPTRTPVEKSYDAIGLVFPVYFQWAQPFSLGIVYRPTFFRPGLSDPFAYEHVISLDFAIKIRVKK
jgi:hypothetical protein